MKKFKLSKVKSRWLPVMVLTVAALCLLLIRGRIAPTTAQAEPKSSDEKGEILAVPLQLDRECYGIAMVDTVGKTLWIYEINNRGPAYNRLKLAAARSWQYDRLLEQYNTAEPRPEQVKALLESLGQQKKLNRELQPNVEVNVPQLNVPDTRSDK